ncbi:MAG: TonB-dependent receptor [Gammaproteobacteria bacterium]|nr:TonB-dependent receptor [Pseudomonadales bacterium]MCP5348602.1 TonB-dependent receptor [Pseudomonadales bacterium]
MQRSPSLSLFLGFTSFSLLASSIALAQQDESNARFSLGNIEVINVEGERGADWSTPFQATLRAQDMRLFERNDVSSALSLLPGVTVQNVGARSEKLVYIRGFNSRQVPLFIDGVPVYVPYDGNFDLSRLLTFDVAEINVGKGFSSVLYGANTLGGSINVVSRRPEEGFRAHLRSGLYLDDDKDNQSSNHLLTLENASADWYVQGNLSWSEQDFFTLPDEFTPTAVEDGGRRDNSATEDMKLSLKLGYTPNATDEYALSYQRQEGEKNTPPYAGSDPGFRARFWRWPEYDKESLYFISRTALGEDEYMRVRIYRDTFYNLLRSFDDENYTSQDRPYAFNSVYDDYSYGASVELGSTRFENHNLRAALQYKRDVHRENDVGAPVEKMEDALLSLGLEDTWNLSPDLSLITGLGWDRQQGKRADDLQGTTLLAFPVATANAWNTQAALNYSIDENWSTHASISRRTRFPTMKDRYSYRLGTAIPNPGLDPEYAVNLEVGINGNLVLAQGRQIHVSAALFRSRIDDTIESITVAPTLCTSAPCSQLQNIGRQENSGVELALTAALGANIEVHGNYTYLDRDNVSSPQVLPLDTPQNKLFAYMQYSPIPQLDLVLSAQHESKRFSATNGSRQTGSFTTTDFKAIWHFTDQVQLEAGGRNLGDELYAFEEGFPEAGRTWFLNANLDF